MVRVTTSRGKRGQQRDRALGAVAAELVVRLVDDHHARRLGRDRLDHVQPGRGTGRVVRASRRRRVGLVDPDLRPGALRGQLEGRAALAVDPARAGRQRQQRVHRVRRAEAHRVAALAAERLQQLLLDLVGAVGRPHVGRGQAVADVAGQVLAQRHRVPVRVAVQVADQPADRLVDRVGDRVGQRVRVLVGVQPDRHVELRCPVRRADPAGRRAAEARRTDSCAKPSGYRRRRARAGPPPRPG